MLWVRDISPGVSIYFASQAENNPVEKRSDHAVKVMRQILRKTEIHARELARAAGLTSSQRMLLQVLEENGESKAGMVATRLGITQATTTSLIDRLEKAGLVHRRRFDTDKRQVWISLTDAGRERISLAPDGLQELFEGRFEGLDSWEQSMLIAALERISGMLDADTLDTAPLLDGGVIDREVPDSR
ncbi:MAG: DNA-binding MarR family transcriptional regulator [Gammaproteobacteria bacterium]|jgi:DNA-binding MarR family transcriptional regulator